MARNFSNHLVRGVTALAGSVAITLTIGLIPAQADPFRNGNPREIGDRTEEAFDAIFRDGNYVEAYTILGSAEPDEPLAYAMQASLAYIQEDWELMEISATATRETAEQLVERDPLRGHLYIAAGHFLEGAYIASTQGLVSSTPTILGKLQQVFSHLNQAEEIDPSDPELNLLRGYMDLMLAVNLPFADPNQAIERLETYGAPSYLVYRGIAIGYRDLRQPDQALAAVDLALAETPDNPDLFYLRAQILRLLGDTEASVDYFQRALEMKDQLPRRMVHDIAYEQCRTAGGDGNECRNVARDMVRTWRR
jgi:tetratricopeptide (TPR) repeat protein